MLFRKPCLLKQKMTSFKLSLSQINELSLHAYLDYSLAYLMNILHRTFLFLCEKFLDNKYKEVSHKRFSQSMHQIKSMGSPNLGDWDPLASLALQHFRKALSYSLEVSGQGSQAQGCLAKGYPRPEGGSIGRGEVWGWASSWELPAQSILLSVSLDSKLFLDFIS